MAILQIQICVNQWPQSFYKKKLSKSSFQMPLISWFCPFTISFIDFHAKQHCISTLEPLAVSVASSSFLIWVLSTSSKNRFFWYNASLFHLMNNTHRRNKHVNLYVLFIFNTLTRGLEDGKHIASNKLGPDSQTLT